MPARLTPERTNEIKITFRQTDAATTRGLALAIARIHAAGKLISLEVNAPSSEGVSNLASPHGEREP